MQASGKEAGGKEASGRAEQPPIDLAEGLHVEDPLAGGLHANSVSRVSSGFPCGVASQSCG
jgi:hypothetical protein